ncbi:MAG TPA: hypothetical protein DIC64_02390 [Alphaproteobacteria bacterium]|nr:hypothetical protein [Alphaproteobacteria bacterium]
MKKFALIAFFALIFSCFAPVTNVHAAAKNKYSQTYTRSERADKCESLRKSTQSYSSKNDGFGNGVIDDDVLVGIYDTTKKISDNILFVSILGDSLMCHATHAGEHSVKIMGVNLFAYPDVPIWLAGAIIYFFGFMMVLSICFYVVDISFKLGFAIILMPVGIALWPFEKTKDKLSILISIFLKSAAIFPFLAISVAYTLGMLAQSLGGLKDIFIAITQNDTDFVSENFSLGSTSLLLVVTALAYGMKLIGTAVDDFANKFFPEKAFGKEGSPMHHLATQAMDFAKQKVVQPVASLAHDITKTQAGKVTEKAGNLLQGKYHPQIKAGLSHGVRNIGIAFRNPKETGEKLGIKASRDVTAALSKTANKLKYGVGIAAANLVGGKENRENLKETLRNARDAKNKHINNTIQKAYDKAMAPVNSSIAQKETLLQQQKLQKQAEKQRKREERMANDPKYRARVERWQKLNRARVERWQKLKGNVQQVGQTIHNVDENRRADIGVMTSKLKDIDKEKKEALIKTENIYQSIDKFTQKINTGKGSARLLRAINNLQKQTKDSIDAGKLAKDANDKWPEKAWKSIARFSLKLGTDALATVTKVPTGLVAGVGNGVVNTIGMGAKLVTGSVVDGLVNNAIRGYYNIQKVPTRFKRGLYKAPDVLKDAWKAPGVILEKTGQTMQHNKPHKKDKNEEE